MPYYSTFVEVNSSSVIPIHILSKIHPETEIGVWAICTTFTFARQNIRSGFTKDLKYYDEKRLKSDKIRGEAIAALVAISSIQNIQNQEIRIHTANKAFIQDFKNQNNPSQGEAQAQDIYNRINSIITERNYTLKIIEEPLDQDIYMYLNMKCNNRMRTYRAPAENSSQKR